MAGWRIDECPCNYLIPQTPFIGTNYFCESGNDNNEQIQILYTKDPL